MWKRSILHCPIHSSKENITNHKYAPFINFFPIHNSFLRSHGKIFLSTKCTVHAKTYILLPRKVPEYAGWVTVAWGSPWGVSSRVLNFSISSRFDLLLLCSSLLSSSCCFCYDDISVFSQVCFVNRARLMTRAFLYTDRKVAVSIELFFFQAR